MTGNVKWLGSLPTMTILAVLAGCAKPPPPVVSTTRVYAVDQQGAAKTCKVSDVAAAPGKQVPVEMAVGNDGGWCALSLSAPDHSPYGAGLLTDRAAHGTVYIHTVGDDTRIDYTPDHGYAGTDKFTVTLLPGEVALAFSVTVTQS
jgi:hypothetical protein